MRVQSTIAGRRRGFTLVEAAVGTGLFALLSYLICQAWAGLGRPAADVAARARVASEARLAVAALARDLGGSLANPEGRLGVKELSRVVGRLQPGGTQLWLCLDGGTAPNGTADWAAPDTVIIYEVQDRKLVRWDQTAGTTIVVARDVDSLSTQNLGDSVRIVLTLSYRTVSRTYTLVARDP